MGRIHEGTVDGNRRVPVRTSRVVRNLQNDELRNEDRPEDLIPLKKEEQDDFMDVVALYSEIDEDA
jgi:hypothetical protein